jgi:hypothetical protein
VTKQNDTVGRKLPSDPDRRRLLVAFGAGLVPGLTGCVGGARDPGGDGGAQSEPEDREGGDGETPETPEGDVRSHLDSLGLEEGTDYDPEGYAVVVYSEGETESVRKEAEGLSSEFDRYGTHGGTMVEEYGNATAVVSVWDEKDAADTAESFLLEIDGVFESTGGPLGEETANEASEEGTPG